MDVSKPHQKLPAKSNMFSYFLDEIKSVHLENKSINFGSWMFLNL